MCVGGAVTCKAAAAVVCEVPVMHATRAASLISLHRRSPGILRVAILTLTSVAMSASLLAAQNTGSTSQQVSSGQQIYNAHCSQCHGTDLKGQSGPALAGPQFKSSIEFSKMSAKQLFNFISTQMPYDNPGSLKKDQYLQVMAYLLSRNNYPAAKEKLTEDDLGKVRLLPYPSGGDARASK
jgi:mono/diheme cytochrome c family protein